MAVGMVVKADDAFDLVHVFNLAVEQAHHYSHL
jgi:hypothetical protein